MIDVSVPLYNGMDSWEGDPSFSFKLVHEMATGFPCNVGEITMSAHSGTHVDAPYHFVDSGKRMGDVKLEQLIGPCQVISVPDEKLVNNMIDSSSLPSEFLHRRVLFKTRGSNTPGRFTRDFVSISMNAAKYLVSKDVNVIGVDSLSIESYYGDGSVHVFLLGKEVLLIETLDLSKVDDGEYELICMPLNIRDGDAAPARCLLRPIKI